LQRLQAARGNILVCCRARPSSAQERAAEAAGDAGGKICVQVADDTEACVYDRRAGIWKPFAFDKVTLVAVLGQPLL